MKKKLLFIFLTIFILLFSLTSCDKKDNDNKDDKKEDIITTLTAPTISSNKNIISWNAVTNAKGYVVNVNDKDQAEQTTTSFELKGDTGSYNIKVKAIGDGTNYKNSEYSNTLTVVIEEEKLDAPQITLNDTLISWQAITDATAYVVNINGVDQNPTTKTNYNFESSDYGSFIIKVKATNNELESDYSNEVEIGIYESYLIAPSITIEDNLVKWESVRRADKYIVNVNGTDLEATTNLSYNFDELPTNNYKFKVKALSNNSMYGPSEYSNEVEVNYVYEIQLDAPTLKLNTNVITWNVVDNATSYTVYVDGVETSKQSNCYFEVEDTTSSHKYKVLATSTNERYLDSELSKEITTIISKNGYLDETTGDFSQYENTNEYVQVTTASEFLNALKNARWEYNSTLGEVVEANGYTIVNNVTKNSSNWDKQVGIGIYLKNSDGSYTKVPEGTPYDPDSTVFPKNGEYYRAYSDYDIVSYTQELVSEGKIHVIEIMNDIELGWNKLSDSDKNLGIAQTYSKDTSEQNYTMSSMFIEYGMSSINISKTNNLLIYSKNGSKILHGGFKINGCKNVCIRNLEFDEMWQWEDTSKASVGKVGDMDAFGWAYFKISTSDEIWIDHCTFGKSYDGQIDISDSTFGQRSAYVNAPYGTKYDDKSDVHISYCTFKSGSDDKDGYLYKMMEEIEADYQAKGNNYLYYKALRNAGYTFDEILYGIAIPQKKAFLDGDANEGDYQDKKKINDNLNLSIAYCSFINIEDRLPKVRSGNVYMYGTIIDCTEYYDYLPIIKEKTLENETKISAKTIVESVNSTWKCAGVSHGYMASMDGSIYVKDSIVKDVLTVICNNESYAGAGGIIIENTRYVFRIENIDFTGSIYDENNPFVTHYSGLIGSDYFNWNNETNSIPFYVESIDLTTLEDYLVSNVGVQSNFNGLTK